MSGKARRTPPLIGEGAKGKDGKKMTDSLKGDGITIGVKALVQALMLCDNNWNLRKVPIGKL